jgi:hypothetical protein
VAEESPFDCISFICMRLAMGSTVSHRLPPFFIPKNIALRECPWHTLGSRTVAGMAEHCWQMVGFSNVVFEQRPTWRKLRGDSTRGCCG